MSLKVLVGITGGIAAYKIPLLIRLLRKKNIEVKVVITEKVRSLVGIEALQTLSGNQIYSDNINYEYDINHIRLSEWADVFLIAPATANTIAKVAHGIADNLLTTLALTFSPSKTIIAPAMNSAMLENPITQENIQSLKKRGFTILPCGFGELACGKEGYGRMAEIDEIIEAILTNISKGKALCGKKVLISLGATEEPIDSVRVISNRSSGKMGEALISEALHLGADVTAVVGKIMGTLPEAAKTINITTSLEMEKALRENFDNCDICIMAAAVSDFRVKNIFKEKIHRETTEHLNIELIPNNDILESLGKLKKNQILIGFALEEKMDKEKALSKMKKKNCDLMILNSINDSLGSDTTVFSIFDKSGNENNYNKMSKKEAAKIIFSKILEIIEK